MKTHEHAVMALLNLSIHNSNKGFIVPTSVINLLRDGIVRGKKDAATAIFNLSIYQGNKFRAKVVLPLIALLVDQSIGMVDEVLAILAILATHQEGRVAIGQQSTIDILMELIHSGSDRNKENVAAILLVVGINDSSHWLAAMQIGVYEYLIKLVQNGTTGRWKARQLWRVY
jgi:hypothetical protein